MNSYDSIHIIWKFFVSQTQEIPVPQFRVQLVHVAWPLMVNQNVDVHEVVREGSQSVALTAENMHPYAI